MARENLLKLRKGTSLEWATTNPILDQGEPGFETDTKNFKVGDGSTTWNNLKYVRLDGGNIGDAQPRSPTEITGTSADSQINLTWAAPFQGSSPITDYIVQFSNDNGISWTTFNKSPSTTTSANITGLTNGISYIFRVAAVNNAGTSQYSTASQSFAPFVYDPNKIVLVFDTSKEPSNNTISLPIALLGTNSTITVDWGDGTNSTFSNVRTSSSSSSSSSRRTSSSSSSSSGSIGASAYYKKTYANPGVYVVQISGTQNSCTLNYYQYAIDNSIPGANNRDKLVRCLSFGSNLLRTMYYSFFKCKNFVQCPIFLPASVVEITRPFGEATSFNQPILWDTSAVNISGMFLGASSFNQNCGRLSVSGSSENTIDLSETALDEENYSKTLIGWAEQALAAAIRLNIIATNRNYSNFVYYPNGIFSNGLVARNYLISSSEVGGRAWSVFNDRFVTGLYLQAIETLRQISSGTQQTITVNDATVQRTTNGQSVSDFEVRMFKVGGGAINNPVITSSNTGILTNPSPQSGGKSTYVSPGGVVFTGTETSTGRSTTIPVTARLVTSQSDSFISFISGSLASNAITAIDSRILGKTAATSLRVFSTQNHTTTPPVYTRNLNFWASDIDFTCCSPWNSTGLTTMAGTLISPRHILFAAHYQINTGATIRFVTADGTVVTRTMTAKATHPNYNSTTYSQDISIGILDSDVPSGISFAKVLPANFASFLPTISWKARIPVVVLDQEEKATIMDLVELSDAVGGATPTDAQRSSFSETIISGDSGNPVFILINNQPILMTVLTFGAFGFKGTNIASQISSINTMMNLLGGGYRLTTVDLSGFPSY